jgi:hypothetical protein
MVQRTVGGFFRVSAWFLQGQSHFGLISRGSLALQVETLYPKTPPTSASARGPQISDSLVSLTFGLCDFLAPRDSPEYAPKMPFCPAKNHSLGRRPDKLHRYT